MTALEMLLCFLNSESMLLSQLLSPIYFRFENDLSTLTTSLKTNMSLTR